MFGWLCSRVETGAPLDPPVVDNLDNLAAIKARGVRENPKIAASVPVWRPEDVRGGNNDTKEPSPEVWINIICRADGKKTQKNPKKPCRNLAERTVLLFFLWVEMAR